MISHPQTSVKVKLPAKANRSKVLSTISYNLRKAGYAQEFVATFRSRAMAGDDEQFWNTVHRYVTVEETK